MMRTFRNCLSLARIVLILARYDVLFFWQQDIRGKGKKLARALHALGPSFIKLGQALSTRADLVGEDIALALAEFQDRLPPFAGHIARHIVAQELEKPLEECFASFENNAAAAASIAQVHFAVLYDGSEVAVKVLRPHIEEAFARDIALFYWLARLAHYWRPDWRRYHLHEVVKTFEDMIRFELDLRFEGAAAVEARGNNQNPDQFYIPQIHWNFTTRHVLTQERIRGIPISDVAAIKEAGHDPAKLLDIAAVGFFNQVFRDGFFHGDLHPGNLFVMKNGSIAVVDFGIMGRLDKRTRIYLAQMLHDFLNEDYQNLSKVHFDAGLVPAHKSRENFAQALMAIAKPIMGKNLNEISIARLLGQLFTTAEMFDMEVQPHLLLLQKNMMIAEGVGRMLNPSVNMWRVAEPLIAEWAKENLTLRARLSDQVKETAHLMQVLPSLMREANAALMRFNEGTGKLAEMRAQRQKFHQNWLWFARAALIALVCLHG